jgi:predicted DNA-binding protein YlxM (UPF0122 family)
MFMIISRSVLLRMRSVSDKIFRENLENLNTYIVFNFFFRKSYRLWHDVEKYGTNRQATYDNIIRGTNDPLCMQISKARLQT